MAQLDVDRSPLDPADDAAAHAADHNELATQHNLIDETGYVTPAEVAALMPKAGGTFTGDVTLAGDPTANLHAATRQYVTAQISAAVSQLLGGAPSAALDTIAELAAALTADESAAAALTSAVAGKLAKASNLSDLVDAAAARTNLGLGSSATHAASDFATPTDLAGYIAKAIVDAAGDLIVGTGPDTVGRLAKGADGTFLGVVGGALAWAAPSGTSVQSDDIDEIVVLTQSAYDAIVTPDSRILYVVVG